MGKNEKHKVITKELDSKLKSFMRQYKNKINFVTTIKYFAKNIKPDLFIPTRSFYIAIDGVNTGGKTSTTRLLKTSLSKMGYDSFSVKTISRLNSFGMAFYKEKWNKAFEVDPFFIAGSTYLQLSKNLKSNTKTFVLLDRYMLSAEVFLEACIVKENPNVAKYVKNWFSAFSLPNPDLQVILLDSEEDYLIRFRDRYGRQPNYAEKEFYNRTKELFLNKSKIDKDLIFIDTSKTTHKEVIKKIITRLKLNRGL